MKLITYLEESKLELLVDVSPSRSHGREAKAETASVLDRLVGAILHLKLNIKTTRRSLNIFTEI